MLANPGLFKRSRLQWLLNTARLKLPFTNSDTLDPRITATRASTKTYFDSTGTLRTTAFNLLTYSEQFDNAAYTKVSSSITANNTTAPDGTLTADKLIASGGLTDHLIDQVSTSISVGTVITQSIFAKSSECTEIRFRVGSAGAFAGSPQAGTFTLTGSGSASVSQGSPTLSISSVGNGWYRCILTTTTIATGAVTVRISPSIGGTTTFNADGSGIYIWGAQLETGSTATDYIRTEAAASGAFPLEYDPSTLVCLGRSFWEARTNLLTYSEQFDNAAWTYARLLAPSANTVVAPDGTTTGDTWTEDSTASNSHYFIQNATGVANTIYTGSIFLKYKTSGRSVFDVIVSLGATYTARAFNIQTGTSETNKTGVTDAGTSNSSITSVGNGWYRCTVTMTASEASTAAAIQVRCTNGTTSTYTGDGTSGLYVWGAQLEAGATPTPYIPTTSASVTRAADVVSMTGTNFSSWYNQTEGTFLETAACSGVPAGGFPRLFDVNDGTSNNRITNQFYSTIINRISVMVGGVSQAAFDTTTISANTFGTSVLAYKANDFAASFVGSAVATDTSGSVPTVNRLEIANIGGGQQLNGWISRLVYWPVRLPNSDLQILSRST